MSEALIDVVAPLEQEGAQAVVRTWLKAVGESVVQDEPLLELETDKVALEVASPASGVLVEQILQPDAEAKPGQVLGRVRPGKPSEHEPRERGDTTATAAPSGRFDRDLALSPSVRRLLSQSGLDPRDMAGSGRGGRLTAQDVVAEIARRAPAKPPAALGQASQIRHTPMRLRIAEHMTRSLATAPHVTAVFEADFSAVIAHRNAHKAEFERRGASLTFMAYIVAAASQAMAAAPSVNSRWHDEALEVFADVNVGIGVALGDQGLIVPVIHNAQSLSLLEIANRVADLTERARAGGLKSADVQGGTFSISNHGVSGSLLAAPIIINQPQSAILGVGKLERRVVAREVDGADAIQIRPMAFVSLSIDHRVLDGVQTNAWLTKFVGVLEGWPAR